MFYSIRKKQRGNNKHAPVSIFLFVCMPIDMFFVFFVFIQDPFLFMTLYSFIVIISSSMHYEHCYQHLIVSLLLVAIISIQFAHTTNKTHVTCHLSMSSYLSTLGAPSSDHLLEITRLSHKTKHYCSDVHRQPKDVEV